MSVLSRAAICLALSFLRCSEVASSIDLAVVGSCACNGLTMGNDLACDWKVARLFRCRIARHASPVRVLASFVSCRRGLLRDSLIFSALLYAPGGPAEDLPSLFEGCLVVCLL